MKVLSITTATDHLSVALTDGEQIIAEKNELGMHNHAERLDPLIDELLKQNQLTLQEIDRFAVAQGPGSYTGLRISITTAKMFASILNKPLVGVDHIMGHIMAAQLKDTIEYPALALQVSGGHTELVLLKSPIDFEIIGDTRDDAAGEAYDKIGRVLGVNYPAGKTIDTWAHQGQDTFKFPRAMLEDYDYDFSFSGLKSAFINTCHHADQINQKLDKYDLAASFQAAVVDVLVYKTIRAIKEFKPKTFILGGGVAANLGLRERLNREIAAINQDHQLKVIMPDLKLCGDNAAMIGAAAYNLYVAGQFSDLNLNADPSLELPYSDELYK